eukprot:s1260_g3.t1
MYQDSWYENPWRNLSCCTSKGVVKMIYLFLCLCLPLEAVEIKEQIGVLPESSETRGFFETLGQAASLVSRGQLLRRHEHWQPCSELSLAACCQREAVRVNDGAGRCRCAQAAEQAELCALEWQSCELPREACCQSLPAMMLVAFGNSSASGYSASCACAPVALGPLNQLQLEQRCAEGNGNGHKACSLPSFVDLDLTRAGPREGEACHKNASAHFTVNLQIGMPYLLRFQVRHSENRLPVDLMIGHQRTSMPAATNSWLERSFRSTLSGKATHFGMVIRAPCASLGEVQFASCKEDVKSDKSGRLADMVALASNRGKQMAADPPSDAASAKPDKDPKPNKDAKPGEAAKPGEDAKPGEAAKPGEDAKPGEAAKPFEGAKPGGGAKAPEGKTAEGGTKPVAEQDVTIDELKDRVKEDEDKITELEYEKNHAEMEKKDAEAAAAEPSGGTVPTWLAVVTVGLVFITGPLLKMKASQKAAEATPKAKAKAAPKGAPKATPKAVPKAGALAPKAAAKSKAVAKAKSAGKLQVPEVSFKQLKVR